jgi:hypothetical protein
MLISIFTRYRVAYLHCDLDGTRRGEANDGGYSYLLSKTENIPSVYQCCVCVCVYMCVEWAEGVGEKHKKTKS